MSEQPPDIAHGNPDEILTGDQFDCLPILESRQFRFFGVVELAEGTGQPPEGLYKRMTAEIRSRLLVNTEVSFVKYRTLPRETCKSALVDYSKAAEPVEY